jgi:hypothetical protein
VETVIAAVNDELNRKRREWYMARSMAHLKKSLQILKKIIWSGQLDPGGKTKRHIIAANTNIININIIYNNININQSKVWNCNVHQLTTYLLM